MTEHSDVFPSFHRVIGIDFGTTKCAVSVWDGSKALVIPPVPAVVWPDSTGQVVAGRLPPAHPGSEVAGIRRRLVEGESVRFRSREYRAAEIAAFLLIELKRQAEAMIGEPVHDAVITVSGTYGEAARKAVTEAAGLAQLNVRRLLEEPVAAAVAFDTPGIFAVYDLGGGTFDAAVLRIDSGGVTVLGQSGDPDLGGDDFDDRIVGYALRQIRERHHVELGMDDAIRQRIRGEAELRKRELVTAESTTLRLPLLTATVSTEIPLTRRAFSAMIEADVERTLAHLDTAMADAAAHGVTRAHVDQVLLVGGATRIPRLRERLAGYFGLPIDDIRADLDPDELIARGAGIVARDYEPSALFDGPPFSLRSANLRLRAEMAVPQLDATPSAPADPPDELPTPPAETPADYRAVADRSYGLLTSSAAAENSGSLRAAYTTFVAAIHAAAPDSRLAALGAALSTALTETA